jgi:NIMA (never in mitosis gene a)-related kinase
MDKYKVVKIVGEGSFGKAYLCQRKKDTKKVIVKKINVARMGAKEVKLTELEATLLSRLRHPNIVSFIESFRATGNLHIVMEFADGGDLEAWLKQRRGRLLSEDSVLHMFVQLSLAIKHIHDRKILHRDLKSQNVFLTSNNVVKLGDFGVSRVLERTMDLAATQVGTPYYMPPEICNNSRYNSKCDIWSLGVMLYELMTLRLPFQGNSMKDLLRNIINRPHTPPSCQYSKQLRFLLDSMLHKNMRQRPAVNTFLKEPFVMSRTAKYVFCSMFFLSFLVCDVCLSLSYPSITARLSAFSDTTWHESNHHSSSPQSINQSSIDTILLTFYLLQHYRYLDDAQKQQEFSHTVLHGKHVLRGPALAVLDNGGGAAVAGAGAGEKMPPPPPSVPMPSHAAAAAPPPPPPPRYAAGSPYAYRAGALPPPPNPARIKAEAEAARAKELALREQRQRMIAEKEREQDVRVRIILSFLFLFVMFLSLSYPSIAPCLHYLTRHDTSLTIIPFPPSMNHQSTHRLLLPQQVQLARGAARRKVEAAQEQARARINAQKLARAKRDAQAEAMAAQAKAQLQAQRAARERDRERKRKEEYDRAREKAARVAQKVAGKKAEEEERERLSRERARVREAMRQKKRDEDMAAAQAVLHEQRVIAARGLGAPLGARGADGAAALARVNAEAARKAGVVWPSAVAKVVAASPDRRRNYHHESGGDDDVAVAATPPSAGRVRAGGMEKINQRAVNASPCSGGGGGGNGSNNNGNNYDGQNRVEKGVVYSAQKDAERRRANLAKFEQERQKRLARENERREGVQQRKKQEEKERRDLALMVRDLPVSPAERAADSLEAAAAARKQQRQQQASPSLAINLDPNDDDDDDDVDIESDNEPSEEEEEEEEEGAAPPVYSRAAAGASPSRIIDNKNKGGVPGLRPPSAGVNNNGNDSGNNPTWLGNLEKQMGQLHDRVEQIKDRTPVGTPGNPAAAGAGVMLSPRGMLSPNRNVNGNNGNGDVKNSEPGSGSPNNDAAAAVNQANSSKRVVVNRLNRLDQLARPRSAAGSRPVSAASNARKARLAAARGDADDQQEGGSPQRQLQQELREEAAQRRVEQRQGLKECVYISIPFLSLSIITLT